MSSAADRCRAKNAEKTHWGSNDCSASRVFSGSICEAKPGNSQKETLTEIDHQFSDSNIFQAKL